MKWKLWRAISTKIHDITANIRTNLDVLDKIVETHRDEIDVELAKLKVEMKGIKDALRL